MAVPNVAWPRLVWIAMIMVMLRLSRRWWAAHLMLMTIVLFATSCGGDSGTAVGTVTVTVEPGEALVVGIGETASFSARAVDVSGNMVSGAVTWETNDTRVATVRTDGVAMGVATGTTVVTATLAGAVGTAKLDVFVPQNAAVYERGVSYFGRGSYVEYIPGDLPVVLSAPHGGALTPSEIGDRTFGTTVTDRNTVELVRAIRDAFIEQTGLAPHVVISHLRRTKLDPNRDIVEAAQGNPYAEQAWREFQEWIQVARVAVEERSERGMYFDIHGHGHDVDRLELGYLLSAATLNQTDINLDALAVVATTSIREIGRDSPLPFSQLLRGPTSFGGFLQVAGVRSVPSPSDPSPGSEAYFTGGYNARAHGSLSDGEMISGIQIEHHYTGLRDTDQNRRAYATQVAAAVRLFMMEHYGFFAPAGE